MPTDYGAAQPIADTIHSGIQKVEHFFGVDSKPENSQPVSKPDPQYHADMLKAANASFLPASESTPQHEVHELHMPQSHGYQDQKYSKGNKAPVQTFNK